MQDLWRFQRDFPAAILAGSMTPEPAWFPVSTALLLGCATFLTAWLRRWEFLPALAFALAGALLLPVGWLITLVPILVAAQFFRIRKRETIARGCELTALLLLPFTTPTLPAAAIAALFLLGRHLPPIGLPAAAVLAGFLRVFHGGSLGGWPASIAITAALLAGLTMGWALAGRRLHERVLHAAGAAVLVLLFPPVLPLAFLLVGPIPRLPRLGYVGGAVAILLLVAATAPSLPKPRGLQVANALREKGRGLAESLVAQPGNALWAGRGELWVLGFEPDLARRITGWPFLMPELLENERMLVDPDRFLQAMPAFNQVLFASPAAETSELIDFIRFLPEWEPRDLNAAGLWLSPAGEEWSPPDPDGTESPVIQARMATWLDAAEQGVAARKWFDAAIAHEEVPAEVHLRRARYLVNLQRMGESLDAVERALEQDARNPAALSIKAQLLFGARDFGKAYDASALLVELQPTDPSALWLHARIAHQVQNYPAEIRMLNRLITIKQKAGVDVTLETVLLGQAYARDGDAKRALLWLEDALQSPNLTDEMKEQVESTLAIVRKRAGLDD